MSAVAAGVSCPAEEHPASAPQRTTRPKIDLLNGVIAVSLKATDCWIAEALNVRVSDDPSRAAAALQQGSAAGRSRRPRRPRQRGLAKIRGGRSLERPADRRRERGDGPLSFGRRFADAAASAIPSPATGRGKSRGGGVRRGR